MDKNFPQVKNDINPQTGRSHQVANKINKNNNKSKHREKAFIYK